MPTKVNDADYSYATLRQRLRTTSAGDHRQIARDGTIQLTNNTTAEWQEPSSHDIAPEHRSQTVVIRLHGHQIAVISPRGVLVCMGHGWRSRTTLSRLNDVLRHNTRGFTLFAKGADPSGRGGRYFVHAYAPHTAAWLLATYACGKGPVIPNTTARGAHHAEMLICPGGDSGSNTFHVPNLDYLASTTSF